MIRGFLWTAGVSFVLLGALITAGIMSSAGLRAMISLASALPAISVNVERVSGRFLDAWQLEGVSLEIPAAVITIDTMSVDWKPVELFRKKLHIADISLRGLSVALRPGSDDLPAAEADISYTIFPLPLSLLIGRLQVDDAVLLAKDETQLLVVEEFHVSARSDQDSLTLSRALLRTPRFGFDLQAEAQLAGDNAVAAEGSWWTDFQQFNRMTGELRVGGTLAQTDVALSMVTPVVIGVSGRVDNLLSEATWNLAGSAEAIELKALSPDWPAASLELNLRTSGRAADYSGSLLGEYSAVSQSPVQVDINISGTGSALQIDSTKIDQAVGSAQVQGSVDFQDGVAWDVSAAVNGLDLSAFSLAAGLKIDADLHSAGAWSNKALHYDVEIDRFSGQLNNPEVELTGHLQTRGNDEGLELTALEMAVGEGLLKLRGTLGWVDAFTWQAELELQDIDPALLGDLPGGSIDGIVAGKGLFSEDGLSFKAVLSSLSGQLAGHELYGGGSVAFQQNSLEVNDAHLQYGENRLLVKGYVADKYDLQFALEGTDLGSLHQMLKGEVQLAGSLTGPRSGPVAQADFSMKDFLYGSFHVPQLTGAFEARLTEDLFEADIVSSGIDFAGSTTAVTGKIGWRDGFVWNTLVQVRSLDAKSFDAPIEALVNFQVSSSGQWTGDKLEYKADIANLDGTLGFPSVALQGAGQLAGDDTGLTIGALDLQVEDGSIKITGHLGWTAGFSWETRLQAEGIDPHPFGSLPEGSINVEVSSSGNISDGEHQMRAEIHQLSGTLAGYELEGGGSISMINNSFETDGLYVRNGGNRLQIEGVAGDAYGLNFIFQGNELNRLYPAVDGTVEISGTLAGTREEPVVNLAIAARGLSFHNFRIADVTGDARLAMGLDQNLHTSLLLNGFKSETFVLDQLSLKVDGTLAQHQVVFEGMSPYGDFTIEAAGQMDGPGWRGVINNLNHTHHRFGNWRQRRPSVAAISADAFELESFCLDSGENSVCVAGKWQPAGPWRAELSDLRLNLADLNHWGVLATTMDGRLEGHLSSAGSGTVVESARGRLYLPELALELTEAGPYQDARWFDTSLVAELNQSILETTISSRSLDTSTIEGTLSIEGFGDLSEPLSGLPLRGNISLDLKDLSPLQTITGDYLVPTGHLTADLAVDGEVGKPVLTGELELQEGGIQFPQLGSSLTEMTGSIRAREDGLAVQLEAVCGEGKAQGAGKLEISSSDWQGVFQINGRDCKLIDLPEMAITASPELDLVVGTRGGRLSGKLMIPRALIKPELMTMAKSESVDVVFIDEQGGGGRWPFIYELVVELGEDITIEGYGLNVGLGGGLTISNNKRIVTGRGVLNVKQGSFTIFGRPLSIDRGRFTFSGGPIDNPALDVSARKIIKTKQFGQEEIVVGVNLIGTVADYEIELYSIPLMEEREIVAYILFDKSFASSDEPSRGIADSALQSFGLSRGNAILGSVTEILPVDEIHFEGGTSENASLVVGRSLTERLSVSYDFNLFKNSGSFRVRYDFGRGFSVQSTSAFESNSVELLYSFER